jgi:hypothetical protein
LIRQIILAGLVAISVTATARAQDPTCQGAGKCICTETIAAKAVLGYNATDDRQSVMVNIVCINQDTMDVTYYQRRKEDGLGASYSSDPVPRGQ